MAPMYLAATLTDGTTVISEFSKLKNAGRYAAQVFAGQRPFNAWTVVGTTHPHSGERVLMRTRTLIGGAHIRHITEVQPKAGLETTHGFLATNFEAVAHLQRGPRGLWTAPATEPVAVGDVTAVAGAEYPVHRDENYRDYVLLRAAETRDDEVRYYLDGLGVNGTPRSGFTPVSSASESEDEEDILADEEFDDELD